MDGTQVSGSFDKAALAQIPPVLQGAVDQGVLSGMVTLIWRRGEIGQVNTIGWRDVAAKAPMQRDTLFRIASMSKPVTSFAILQLVEEGKLRLDDPVKRWLPELADRQVLKDPAGPLTETYPSPRDITVEDLLTHRSGLAYSFSSVGPIAKAYDEKLGSAILNFMTPDEWLARLGELPLTYPPGERMHYSHGTDVLGFLLARIDGKTLGQALSDRIFGPLGMTDTMFWVPPEKRGRLAHLYKAPADGGPLQDVSFPIPDRAPPFEGGGGALVSTVDDYLKFARMLLGKGELDGVRLAKPETIELMTTNRLTPQQRAMPFLGFPMWTTQGFGLGLSMIMDPVAHQIMGAGSLGAFTWPGAFGTWWQADPAEDAVLIYLIQDNMDLGPEAVTNMQGQRPNGRLVLPVFQKLAYAAFC
jgi:CubicO group peptidase (beta-lactamase class C family)